MKQKWMILTAFSALLLTATAENYRGKYKVKRVVWERLEVTKALDETPSLTANAIVEPYKAKVDSMMMPALGLSRVAMAAGWPESLLGNWVADVLVEAGTATGLEPADMGLINLGGLRANMPEGIVRVGDILLISPFQNSVVVLEMKGTDVLELMGNIASAATGAVSSSVRLSVGSDGSVLSSTIGGREIDPKATYTIATIDYLAEGNDKLTALKKASKRHDIGLLMRDALSEYVLKHRIIDSKIEGRITIAQ